MEDKHATKQTNKQVTYLNIITIIFEYEIDKHKPYVESWSGSHVPRAFEIVKIRNWEAWACDRLILNRRLKTEVAIF